MISNLAYPDRSGFLAFFPTSDILKEKYTLFAKIQELPWPDWVAPCVFRSGDPGKRPS